MNRLGRKVFVLTAVTIAGATARPRVAGAAEESSSLDQARERIERVPAVTWGAIAIVVGAAAIWFIVSRSRTIPGSTLDAPASPTVPGPPVGPRLGVGLLGAVAVGGLATLSFISATGSEPRAESAQATAQGLLAATTPPVPSATDVAPSPTSRPVPTATPRPAPTATPRPRLPFVEPLRPTADGVPDPQLVQAGTVHLEIHDGLQFVLGSNRTVNYSRNHAAIYVGDSRQAEVDIFVPHSLTATGRRLFNVEAIADALTQEPLWLDEIGSTTIGGRDVRIFEGRPVTPAGEFVRVFETSAQTRNIENSGWYAPALMRLWLIDSPGGPVAVTAEVLVGGEDLFDATWDLAEDIVFTMSLA